ncbi:tyrosine-type recombinase/integrase [Paraburkholderia hospita]|uniref:tyrosine-type recombinase/integrase n=1 Tax=Paraburkholderia hospita TaxID=169430 RepID=UPI000B345749|nr:tyrosine-type recombinase/integrase [Paraburkholderia hospita]OUL70354.1 integrase [Paraburkholderia hospita]
MNDHTASTALDPVISRYLAHRRALGRQYDMQERTLHSLTDFLVQVGESDLSSALFDSWCKTFDSLTSNVRRARQVAVRNFCLYRQRTELRCFVPDINRFARPQPHAAPIILTPAQVGRLLELAGTREATPTSPLRPYVLRLALVLLYTAGLRRRELLRLTLTDVDAQAGVLRIRESKFHKSRWVPLSCGARRELHRYLVRRLATPLDTSPSSPLLCNLSHGLRGYTGTGMRRGIMELLHEAGIRDVNGRIPRIQDFRHSFAIESLMRWYRQGADVQSNLPKLALYMGHVSIVSTAYYLRWTPALQELASNRFAKRFGYLVRGEQR